MRAIVLLSVLGIAAPAAAHGRFPESQQLVEHPTDADVLAVATTFGVVLTRDGGASWRWICRLATEASVTEDPVFVMGTDGALMGAVFDGLVRSTDGCDWELPSPMLTRRVVFDLVRHPTESTTLFALTSDGGSIANSLFRSEDDGLTWVPTSDPIEPILFERVRVSPSDPQRIYLSGAYPRTSELPRRPFVHRSRDGGATWEALGFEFRNEDEKNLRVLAVDPTNPDVVFMRVVKEPDADLERLVRSRDAGETWETILDVPDLTSLLIAPDGTIWVGGRNPGTPEAVLDGGIGLDGGAPMEGRHGLWRSNDGGDTFTVVRGDLSIGCLAWRDGELWACGANYQDGFALGRSADEGRSFETLLRFQEMAGPVQCEAGTDTPTTCAMSPGDMDIMNDLLVEGPTTPSSGGCGCTTSGAPTGAVLPLLFWLLWERRHAFV